MATRRQLRAARLRPGGHEPVAILRCKACATRPQRTCTRPAYLYRIDLAKPIRPRTLAKEKALDAAMAARTTCPICRRRYHHCLPLRTLGSCVPCHDGIPADPSTYIHEFPPRTRRVIFCPLWRLPVLLRPLACTTHQGPEQSGGPDSPARHDRMEVCMTETLIPSARPYAPDSPLAHLLDMAHAADIPSADEQRDDAETAAAHHIYEQYTDTLARVIEACDWSGYPALRSKGFRSFEPSAVVWLDGGLWLHHTLRISEDGADNVLTLITPCTCGRGYVDVLIENETDLLAILADLRPTGGRVPHGEAGPSGCGSTRPPTSLSPWR